MIYSKYETTESLGGCFKVHIFWEGHKILRNLHQLFVLCTASQIIGGEFAKFCGFLSIHELYEKVFALTTTLLQRFGNDGQPLIPATILRGEHTKLDEEVYDVTAFTQFVLYSFFFIIILQIIGILLADKAPIQVNFLITCHKK